MAYVGTVSFVDPAGDALLTRRDAISGAEEPRDGSVPDVARRSDVKSPMDPL